MVVREMHAWICGWHRLARLTAILLPLQSTPYLGAAGKLLSLAECYCTLLAVLRSVPAPYNATRGLWQLRRVLRRSGGLR